MQPVLQRSLSNRLLIISTSLSTILFPLTFGEGRCLDVGFWFPLARETASVRE